MLYWVDSFPFSACFLIFFAIVILGFYQHTTAGADHCVTLMGTSTTGRSDRLDHSSIPFPPCCFDLLPWLQQDEHELVQNR